MFLVDSHCHLDFPEFESELPDIIKRAQEANVKTLLTIGTRSQGWPRILKIAETYPGVFATIGMHPTDIEPELLPDLLEILIDQGQHSHVVGFGETGLDFYHQPYNLQHQFQSFEAHVQAALHLDLPIVVHTRDAEEATAHFLTQSASKGSLKGVIHCFSGSKEFAHQMLDLGFYISFSGVVTFKNALALQEVARSVPVDRLLVETDAPFLAPHPLRGKRNEPSFVVHTAKKIAELKGVSCEEIAQKTTHNFFTLFSKVSRP